MVSVCPLSLGLHPFQASALQVGIERIEAIEERHRDQEIAPRVLHQTLYFSLVIALAGTVEPVLEQVVRPQFGEGAGALTPAVSQYLRHGQLGLS